MHFPKKTRGLGLPTHNYVGETVDTLLFYITHCRVMTSANYCEAKRAKFLNRTLTILLLISSFLMTVAPVTVTQLFPASAAWLNSMLTILGALTVSLAAIQYALALDDKAACHKAAAAEFSRIRREMELLATEPREEANLFRRHLELHLRELSVCASLAPLVSDKLVGTFFSLYGSETKGGKATVIPLNNDNIRLPLRDSKSS
jgi:hypothetical protein